MVAAYDALGWALALGLCVPGLRGRPLRAVAVFLVAAIVLHVPLGGTSALALLRGAFGSAAFTTVALLAALALARAGFGRVLARGEALLVAALATLAGLFFYPPALGLGPVDPYAWGYAGTGLAAVAGLMALVAGAGGRWVLAAGLVLALVGWRLQLLESPNLWDYLLDPMLALGGLLASIALAARGALLRARRG